MFANKYAKGGKEIFKHILGKKKSTLTLFVSSNNWQKLV